TEPNTDSQFIKRDALYSEDTSFGRQRQNVYFKGEAELITALNVLSESKQKAVVYFLQGNGELDITDSRTTEIDRGAGVLKRRLEANNVTVKGLEISVLEDRQKKNPDVEIKKEVPKDATVVVIAGPRRHLPQTTIDALRAYMNPPPGDTSRAKGKL